MNYYHFNNGDLLELPLLVLFKQTISIFNLIKILCGHDGIRCSKMCYKIMKNYDGPSTLKIHQFIIIIFSIP